MHDSPPPNLPRLDRSLRRPSLRDEALRETPAPPALEPGHRPRHRRWLNAPFDVAKPGEVSRGSGCRAAGTIHARSQSVKRRLRQAWHVLSDAVSGFSEDGGPLISAALAFHTLLSLAPLVIISVAVASTVLGEGAAMAEVTRLMRENMGPKVASTVTEWVNQASRSSEAASILGGGLVLFAASRLGENLREAMNRIFNVAPNQTDGLRGTVKGLVRRRLFAFGLALAAGPLLVAVFASRALLTRFHHLLFPESAWAAEALQLAQLALAFVVIALGSALVLRFVPDQRLPLERALGGGVLISIAFNVGNALIGLYLGRAGVGAAYGLASSAVVVLLWLQFSSILFLFACEIVQAYGRLKDSPGEEAPAADREATAPKAQPRAREASMAESSR